MPTCFVVFKLLKPAACEETAVLTLCQRGCLLLLCPLAHILHQFLTWYHFLEKWYQVTNAVMDILIIVIMQMNESYDSVLTKHGQILRESAGQLEKLTSSFCCRNTTCIKLFYKSLFFTLFFSHQKNF